MNAAGGKEDPVIIGYAVQPHCFKHPKDRKRPYGCQSRRTFLLTLGVKVKEGVLVQKDEDPEMQEEIGVKVLCVDDEEENALEIKSHGEALLMAEKLLDFARFKGNEKVSLVLSKSTDQLEQEIVI